MDHSLPLVKGGSLETDSLSPYSQSFDHGSATPIAETRPPFLGVTTLGTLFHARSRIQAEVRLFGSIDSDMFLANGEWSYHQLNYLSCTCSYSLSPRIFGDKLKLKPESSSHSYDINGFAMSISAIESDCEPHESCVEIVQHAAHGRYGADARAPAKVHLSPRKPPSMDPGATMRTSHPVQAREHTFDRLEVKAVTAGNGRQPGGQLYFQLVIELWADLGSHHPARFIKVACMKSAAITLRRLTPRAIDVPPSDLEAQQARRESSVSSRFDSEYLSDSASVFDFESDLDLGSERQLCSFSTLATESDIQLRTPFANDSNMKKYVFRAPDDESNAPYSDDELDLQASTDLMLPSSHASDERPSASVHDQLDNIQAPDRNTPGLLRRLSQTGLLLWLKKLSRPRPRPGYRRIEWTCDCGVDLYGDFSQEEPSDLDALEASLQSPAQSSSPASDSSDAEGIVETPPLSQQTNSSIWNAGTTASSTVTDASSVDLYSKFLAICVNTGGMYKKLAELDTSRVKSDSEAFSLMKQAYLEHRGLRSRLSLLLKPVTVEFVRFTLWNLRHGYVSITDRPESMPPKTAIDYDFIPPPMPPEVFIHYLEHGDGDLSPNRQTWLPRLPQRLNGKVLHCGEAAEGWGIHVVEGPNRAFIFWIIMVTVSASVLASVLWSSIRGDIQGAMGLGALIVAVPPVIMTAFLFRLEAM
ncbi:p53-like transcription factor [Trichoderma gracile]